MIISQRDLDESFEQSSYLFTEKTREIEVPRVEPLLSEHLDNAFESIEADFEDDPLALYLKAGKERSPFEQEIYKRVWKFQHNRYIRRKVAYTINAGDALIIATPPEGDIAKPSPIERIIDFIVSSNWSLLLFVNRRQEQVKRVKELQAKTKKILEVKLGERIKSMVYVDLLATKPELQGLGYGTALLNNVLFSADIKGRAVCLTTGNMANVPFYESFGFVNVGHFSLGEDNPKLESPPVMVPLMVREAKADV